MSFRLTIALAAAALLAAAAVPAHAADPWERQNESISCADDTGSSPFYRGDSASTTYDATFKLGHEIPAAVLDSYVPQGLGTWRNWNGAGEDILLQTGYNDTAHRAAVVGMVPRGGSTQAPQLKLPGERGFVDAHVGGAAVVGPWMFVAGPEAGGLPTILRYKLDKVRAALASGRPLKAQAQQTINPGAPRFHADFMSADGTTIWIGTFDENSRNRMYQYAVGPKGGLKRLGGANAWTQVPKKTQGLAVTDTHFIFSTSHGSENRSNVYVIRRGKKFLDNAYPQDLVCFAAPSMSEGITLSGGEAFVTFESGSYKYRSDPCDKPIFEGDCTRNVINHLHRAPLAGLLGMT